MFGIFVWNIKICRIYKRKLVYFVGVEFESVYVMCILKRYFVLFKYYFIVLGFVVLSIFVSLLFYYDVKLGCRELNFLIK